MTTFKKTALSLAFILAFASCSSKTKKYHSAQDKTDEIEIVILQMNDVYEIAPIADKFGGLAKVAAVRKELLEKNPNTITVLAGDFLNPSAIGAATVDGRKLNGKQMVSCLNEMKLDIAVFGNHEYDIDKPDLLERISEAKFTWFAGNNIDPETKKTFAGLPRTHIQTFKNDSGVEFKLGFVSSTIPSTKQKYVIYEDEVGSIKSQVQDLKKAGVDAIVGLTHVEMATDMKIASAVPELKLIMGGHEHEKIYYKRSDMSTPIAKADANARTVYIHVIHMNKTTKTTTVDSMYRLLDENAPNDPHIEKFVNNWVNRAYDGYRAAGFEPSRVAFKTEKELDGRMAIVRNEPNYLSKSIVAAIRSEVEGAQVAFFNTGAIRIDDILYPGDITEYDVIRTLPFGDVIFGIEITGADILAMIKASEEKKGQGMYLVYDNVTKKKGAWYVGAALLNPKGKYLVAVNSYLRKYFGQHFVKEPAKNGRDMRRVFIDYMKKHQ